MSSTSDIDLSKLPPKTADLAQIWLYLQVGIDLLMDSPEVLSPTGYMNLCVTVYNVAMGSKAGALDIQNKLRKTFVERAQLVVKEAVKIFDSGDLLQYYVTKFDSYKCSVERVNRVFAFYNRWGAGKGLLAVYSLALTSWKENCTMTMQGEITNAILHLIMEERKGGKIPENLVKNAIDSFIIFDIDFYQDEFEAPFLQATAEYYKNELGQVFQRKNLMIPDYLDKIEEYILDEELRAERYRIPQRTHSKAIAMVLIDEHCQALAQRLLENGQDEELRKMYNLLSRIKPNGLHPLKKSFEVFVGAQFTTEVSKSNDIRNEESMSMNGLNQHSPLHIQQRGLEIVDKCFRGDANFATVVSWKVRKKGKKGKKHFRQDFCYSDYS